jgi:hypothetical protein
MKKDIDIRKVEDLAIALVPRDTDDPEYDYFWDAYLINLKEEPIKSVLVNSRGYGEVEGEKRQTATFRHFWETIGALEIIKIEPVSTELFSLANEFWVSFSHDNYLYDRKYVFVQGSLDPMHFTEIPFLDKRGVMIL